VIANLFGLSQTQALVVIFLLAPLGVALVLVPLYAWASSRGLRPLLTSEILASGLPGEGQILSVRNLGSVLDLKPMVRLSLAVSPAGGDASFEVEVVQAFPRAVALSWRPGDLVEVRFTPDRRAAAVVWGQIV